MVQPTQDTINPNQDVDYNSTGCFKVFLPLLGSAPTTIKGNSNEREAKGKVNVIMGLESVD